MAPNSIEDQFGSHFDFRTSWLNGYRRHYGQESEWRTTEDGKTGNVLTVTNHPAYRCNVVVLSGVQEAELEAYRERETGYDVHTIGRASLTGFKDPLPSHFPDEYLLPVGAWKLDEWRPLQSYLQHCDSAAAAHNEEFYDAFIRTTFRFGSDYTRPHL